MGIRVFWSEPTGSYERSLRRYSRGGKAGTCSAMPGDYSYHNASTMVGLAAEAAPNERSTWTARGCGIEGCTDCIRPYDLAVAQDDPRWPAHCACGHAFTDDDEWQVNDEHQYAATTAGAVPIGATFTLRHAPVGAMWDATWMKAECWRGPDGIALSVQTPGGTWQVDSECSNCTRTQYGPKEIDGQLWDKVWLGRSHYCWVRHGDPRTGTIHVDKNGETCNAGAGSILAGGWHGFLHNNELGPA